MKFSTSDKADIPADVRLNIHFNNPTKEKRLFLGIHLDFSTHQILLYLGLLTIFVEIKGIQRDDAVHDKEKLLWRCKFVDLVFHNSNYSKHFFNLGILIQHRHITLFFWQLRLKLWNPKRLKIY